MTVKVLGISGSPHRHGNTETLLDTFLEGAEGAGAEVRKVVLRELSYTTCRGCNACHNHADGIGQTCIEGPLRPGEEEDHHGAGIGPHRHKCRMAQGDLAAVADEELDPQTGQDIV